MKESTVSALNRINRRFYERYADDFSRSRWAPWPGWHRVVRRLLEDVPDGPLSILDAGCGNARFGVYLEAALGRPFDYLGLDASAALLEIAAGRLTAGPRRRWMRIDLAEPGVAERLPDATFDLVAAFGLLHHLPGQVRRGALLAALASRLAPGGMLAVSFWQFGASARIRRRIVPWEQAGERALAESDLEPGDHLIAWGEADRGVVRYCHETGPEEAGRLVAALGLEPLDCYRADGDQGLNLYHLLRRPRVPGAAGAG